MKKDTGSTIALAAIFIAVLIIGFVASQRGHKIEQLELRLKECTQAQIEAPQLTITELDAVYYQNEIKSIKSQLNALKRENIYLRDRVETDSIFMWGDEYVRKHRDSLGNYVLEFKK